MALYEQAGVSGGGERLKYGDASIHFDASGNIVLTDARNATLHGRVQVPKRVYTEFRQNPLSCGSAGGAPTGTAGDVNFILVPGNGIAPAVGFEQFIIGTQTILVPVLASGGLNITQDLTNGDGAEFDLGITTQNPCLFTARTDACYLTVTAKLTDVSGASPFIVGFRKQAARNADYTTYSDYAAIGAFGADIKTATALNNAAQVQVLTDTTDNWADGDVHTLEVWVDAAGNVTYRVDGAAPTVTVAYRFDAGDLIMPFIRLVNGADIAESTLLSLFDCGLQN